MHYGRVTPAAQVRVVLAFQLQQGVPFDKAWRRAITSLPRSDNPLARAERDEWVHALRWARPVFKRLYLAQLARPLVAAPPALELAGGTAAVLAVA